MPDATKTSARLVTCPACCNDDPDIVLNSDDRCAYCEGTGEVTGIAALEWEIALLQVANTKLAAENQTLRNQLAPYRKAA